MSTLKVNEIDSKTGTTISVAATKTLDVPAGASLTVEGTANLTSSTLTLPATLPATAGTNITSIPGANITGTIPAAALSNVDTTSIEDDLALLGFKVAANGSLAKYNLDDQTVDAFEDASGVDASASTNEVRNASNYYSGSTDNPPTGGTTNTYGAYRSHTYETDSNFVVPSSGNVDLWIVGGGGGSSDGAGGGGGAREITSVAVTAQTYAIDVGAGGAAATSGSNSIALGYTANGGGRGGNWNTAGTAGGSGGGGSGNASGGGQPGGAGNTPSTSPSQGASGGAGEHHSAASANGGGGGGGVDGVTGGNATNTTGGTGGAGTMNDFKTGSDIQYGGGGGGGNFNSSVAPVAGGAGGGGAGRGSSAGTDGTDGLGGGGGGNYHNNGAYKTGGDGVVIIRYLTAAFTSSADLTLVSNSTTAEAVATKGDIVMTYTNGAGTATINTDLTAEFSADNGSTWTSTTLVAQGSTGAHLIVSAHNVALTSTSGTSMVYRIKTLNQGVSKETRIQAVSLGWS